MLVEYTDDEVDENVVNKKNEVVFKLKKIKDLYYKTLTDLAEYTTKYDLYTFMI